MKRTFVYSNKFDSKWKYELFSDENLRLLELFLLVSPSVGDVVQGTGGLRKLRWQGLNTGKSGGIRVLYLDIPQADVVFMIDFFPKSEKDNLTTAERNFIRIIVEKIKKEYLK